MPVLLNSSDHVRSRMILRVSHNSHPSAKRSYHIAFGNRVLGIVGTFRMNVRLNGQQQLLNCWFIKYRHQVHSGQGRNYFGSLRLRAGEDGPLLSTCATCSSELTPTTRISPIALAASR